MMALAMTQQQALWDLHRKGRFTPQVKPGTVRMLVKQGLVTGDWYEARLTDSGLQLASELFGSPAPDPASAPVADDPADTVADEAVTPHKAGDIVDVCGVQLEAQGNGLLKPLPPVAVKPVSGVQWLTRDDLKFAQFRDTSPLQSAWWGEWYFRQTFAYNAPVTVASKPSRVLKPRKVSYIMNMAKGGKKSDTRALTPMSRRGKPLTPAIPMKAWRKQRQLLALMQMGVVLSEGDNVVTLSQPQPLELAS